MARERMTAAPGFDAPLGGAGWTGAGALLDLEGGEPVARSRSTSVVRLRLPDGRPLYLKRYRFPGLWDRLRGLFRGVLFGRHKAAREFENLRLRRADGFPVPEPVAFGERRGLLLLRDAFVVTLGIEDVRPADAFLAGSPPETRRALIDSAADLLRRLHLAGYTDGSCSLRNFLVRGEGASLEIFKVDVPRGRKRVPPGRCAVLDLARLDAGGRLRLGERERLRFLRTYLGGRLGPSARRWIAAIEKARTRFDAWEAPRLGDGGL